MEDVKKSIEEMIDLLTVCMRNEMDRGIEYADTSEMYEVADILKDLCEAHCKLNESCYYVTVIEAMNDGNPVPMVSQKAAIQSNMM